MNGWRPDRAAVITTARRADRAGNVRAILERRLGVDVEVVEGVDGHDRPAPPGWLCSPQAWGCRESHLRVLDSVRDGQSVLVLEDDAAVPERFGRLLGGWVGRVPGDWEALMLGGEHRGRAGPELVGPGVVRCVRTVRTHAYLLRGPAVAVAREACRAATCHWDGPLGKVLGARRRTYAPEPFLIGTTRSPSSIPDSRPLPP